MTAKKPIVEAEWEEQIALYELGFINVNEIAMALGVAPSTVSRQMRSRGILKGARVKETVADLQAALERKARCAALLDLSDSQRRRRVVEANLEAVGKMVAALLEADRQGDLSMAAPVIDSMGSMLGQRRKRRRQT